MVNREQASRRPMHVEADGAILTFSGSSGVTPGAWRYAANALVRDWQQGIREFTINTDLDPLHSPEFDVPMAATLEGFRSLGAEFDIGTTGGRTQDNPILSFLFPLDAAHDVPPPRGEYFSRVWRFDAESITGIADAISTNALERVAWAEGAWDYFVIILYELIDNVNEHSGTGAGFLEVQIHNSGTVLITVADAGRGIRQSFLRARDYAPRTDADAIQLAIQEGVTSLPTRGRGNGLFFATKNAAAANGQFSLESGETRAVWRSGALDMDFRPVRRFSDHQTGLPLPAPMTIAVLDFDARRSIDSIQVLGHEPIVPERERYEEGDALYLSVADRSRGTATRSAARQFRNMIETLHNQSDHKSVVIDFADIRIISMSYADELIGQLASDLGPAAFMRSIRLENASPTVQRLLDRAIDLRFKT